MEDLIPGVSTAKLIGGLVGILAVLAFVGLAFHWKHDMTARGQELAIICKATRDAAAEPKLACSNVPTQISELGAAVKTTTAALNDQNAKVDELGAQTAAEQAQSAEALKTAVGRAQSAEVTSEHALASSRSPARLAQPCEPSKTLAEAWK